MAVKARTTGPEVVEFDPEMLVRRGNYVVLITPELAGELLSRNRNNRNPKTRKIRQYARDMEAGKWDPDASVLLFDRKGDLIDGQNRLMACESIAVPFATMIRTGLRSETRRHVDTGAARTTADVLKMEGVTVSAAGLGAAVGLRQRYEDRVHNYGGKRVTDSKGSLPPMTHEEMLEYLAAHPNMEKMGSLAEAVRRQVIPTIPVSVAMCAFGMFADVDENTARSMGDRLIHGEYGGVGDPLVALIAYAARVRQNPSGNPGYKGRQGQESHLLAMIRVWNALRAGQKIEGPIIVKITDRLVMPQ